MSVGTSIVRLGHPQISNPSNPNATESDIHNSLNELPNAPIRNSAQTIQDAAQRFEGVIPAISDKRASAVASVNRPIQSVSTEWEHFAHITLPTGLPIDELIPWGHS
jgi:hypothetical protein